jgi:hypothetical protein
MSFLLTLEILVPQSKVLPKDLLMEEETNGLELKKQNGTRVT